MTRLRSLLVGLIPLTLLLSIVLAASPARADRIRDLAEIRGARENQLVGYGVVIGLAGTGDNTASAPLAVQSTLAMLRRLGVQIDARQLLLRNIAAVMVTATIPPFSKPGTRLDVTVASIGDARSIQGGVLVQTVLKGADRKTYAVAQGNLVVGGFSAKGRSGSSVSSGNQNAGRIPGGGLVEREIPTKFVFKGKLSLSLRRPSFTLASRVAAAINKELKSDRAARPIDGGTVEVTIPKKDRRRAVDLIARIHALDVKAETSSRVVVSQRTQTIVAGGDVRLKPVAVVHGNLTITIKETPVISQPGALANGDTATASESEVEVQEKVTNMKYLDGAASLGDLTRVLGTLGLSARELINVLQALRAAGALEAEIVVQ
ncbi:MAG: flagellar basal body P-ring protein FlgI [Myxococcota bacterium]